MIGLPCAWESAKAQGVTPETLLLPRPEGLYCPPGDFFIDPVRSVDRAVITHGHSDHARAGHHRVLATVETLAIMAKRYGENFASETQSLRYGEGVDIKGVKLRFIPAGHVLGSAQVVVEHGGLRMIVSGDYKRRRDPTCAAFEPMACDVFITEATFALPVFHHPDDRGEIDKLLRAAQASPERAHLVGAYSLGKAQRVIALAREAGFEDPITIHGAMTELCALYEHYGVPLGPLRPASAHQGGGLVICPPTAIADRWSRRFADPVDCFASGWMGVRQRAKQRGVELPLVISDHADWAELTATIEEIDPGEVWVTHGRDDALARWAALNGRRARPLRLIGYDDEGD